MWHLIGLVVGLSGVDKAKAAGIGFSIGLLVFALLSINSWSVRVFSTSLGVTWPPMILPIALMSVLVAVVAAG
jgi:hypothetical protein